MSDFIQITVAVNSEESAHTMAEVLVEKRLAASCWVSGPIISRYWWKGAIEKAQEWVCTAKTRADLYRKVEQAIKEMHPYEVPGILAIPVEAGSQAYFEWIAHETGAHDRIRTSKELLIQELIEAHEKLIAAATAAYERGARRTSDAWGPREILAHVAGWEAMAVARIPRIVAGIPPITYATEAQHAAMDDAINATVLTMIGDQPFEAICSILRKTYQTDAQIISELDVASTSPGSYVYERTKAAIKHCHEHIQALEQLDFSDKALLPS